MTRYFISLCLYMVISINAARRIKSGDADIILAKAGETIDIVCENNLPLSRCGFTHPNGTKISFVNVVPGTPSCTFTTDATISEIGLWACHLWTPTSQEEILKTVEVRAAHKFAAPDREVGVREGEEVTLSCVTSEGMVPLNDCYFISPARVKIHIDDTATKERKVLKKYFFPRDMSIHRGDCSITIASTATSDAGTWSCHGWLALENREYSDSIQLTVHSDISLTNTDDDGPIVISVTTYVCSTLGFLCLFTALVYWKYRYYTNYYGKTWGDDDSINSFVMKQHVDPTRLILADHLLVT